MGTPVNIVVGSHVWVEDPVLAWIDGEVFEIKNHQVHVNTTSGKTVVADVSKVFPKDTEAPPGGVDDMTKLSYLHEPGVLENLGVRFAQNEIYTYTGNILIAINPFQRLPHLNSQEVMERYKGADIGELSPHVFAIAEAAYRAMIHERKSNSVLVSGESGAGKTETTKMLMRYLAFLGGRAGSEERSVEQQVLESNPVLEAFGNAKTIRNNNSSRFGKFVEIQFDDKWKISGAAVRTYLLERSRVCQINSPERNYHAFYFLCAAPSEDIKKYKLADPKTFHYLNQSTCIKVDRIDDAYEYLETRRAMDIVGINEQDQEAIFRVVASILHLGNVDFAKGKEADSSVIKDEKSRFHLETTAELLMCDSKKLEKALVTRLIVTREEVINRALDPASALISRDGLAKTLYSRLFDWLVETINKSIGQDPNSKQLIGVLDIYGFESFKTNSFEQLCINFTNEKLQQHFNQHVFKMEQEEYTREDIKWSYIEYVDNTDVLDLIEKKPGGVIALLDEACMFPRATYETFAQKMYQTFKNHKRFTKPKLSRTDFTISHYAGDVTYQADYFLDKNKDYIVAEHQELLNASKCSFVSGLFPPLPEESSKSTKFSSIGTRFKLQLQSLMETLNSTEPHYIRCVKPNNLLKPSIFEKFNISQQLRCNGVLEAIRISCAGFPTRKTFQEFINRFKILAPEVLEGNYDEKIACQKLLDKAGLVGYQIGKTKVFLRAGQMAELDARRTEVLGRAARTIQRQVKTHIAHKEFLKLRRLSIIVQSHWRGRMACKLFKYMRREAAAVKIQKNLRQHFARKLYTQLRSYAITLQTGLRAMAARKEFRFRKHARAATHIQAQWRRHRDFSCYQALKKATLIYQCAWRRRLAGKELKKLKMAAKETGALKDAKDKLEKRVEELISLLELEKQLRIDLEETKALEIAKLQDMLLAVQLQVEEANATIIKEREAPPAAQEVPVFVQDTEKINSLTADIEKLEGLLLSERQATDAAKTELAKAQERDEELLQKSEEAERKYHELEALLSERQLTEEAKEELAEAQERNEELLKKSEDAERKIDEIQALFEAERQSTDVAKKELAETRESIEELLKKFEDSERKVDELQVSLLSEKQATDESKEALEKLLEKSQDAERKIDELEALLLSERQSTGETKTAFSEAHARNKELLEKSEDAERKNDELYALLLLERQSTDLAKNELAESQKKIEESLKISEEAKRKIGELQALLLSERQETDEVKKALAEAQERNEESHVKSEDSERKFDELQALFLSERQSSDAAKKELAKAEERNEDLLKKSEDAERKNDQLQALLLSEKQAMDAAKKALGESEERNKESCLKYEVAERKIDELQAKFLSERESNCAAKKELSEAQETNKGLVKKYEDAERKIEQLQGLLFLERQAADAANKALSEAQGRNKDSYEKFEYATTNFLQLQALILSERQSTDEARRALAEANVKSKELLEKSKESERKIDDLQVLLLSEKQATDAANEALAEAQEKSKESRVKFEDAERKIIELQALFLLERQSTDAAKKELAEAQEINEQLIMKSENAERTLEQLQALLLSERQATAEVSIALAEAHERNQRLLEKAEDAERKADELQTLFLSERQSTDAAKKELAEAQLRNEELLVKSEDAKKKINQLEALMFSERQAIDETKKALGEAQKKNEELCVRFEDAERKIDEIQALFLSERQSNDAAKMELAKATERIGELLKQSEDFQRKIDELQVQLLSVKQSTDAAKKELAEVQDRNKELYKKSEDSDRKNEQLQGMLLLERQATDAAKHALAEAQERNKESYDKFDYAVRNFLQLQAMVLSEKQSTDEAKKALAEANIRNKELLEKSEDADRKIDELQSLLLSESQSIDAAKKALAEAEERNEESHMKSEDAERKIAELQAQLLSERQSTEAAKKELSGAQEKNEEITRKYEDVERKFEQLQALLLSERQETNEAKKTLAEANERNKELLKKSEDTERKTDELQALFLSERQSTDEANKKLSEAQERIQELLKKSEDAERKIDQLQALLISESQATDGTKKALAESEKRNEEAHVKFKYAQRKIDELQAMFLSERQSTGAAKKGLAEAWERNNELIRRSEDAERKIEHLQALFLIERQATDAAKKALAVAQEMLLSERQSTDAAKRELSEAMTRNKRLHEKSENAERKIKQLQVSLLSERQATDTTKKALAEAQQRNVQLLKKSEDAESKIDQLENTIERLEEEVSDLKSDNDLLHQKAISASPSAKSSAACPKPTNIQKTSENGKLPNDKTKPAFDTTPKVFETEEKSKGSFIEMQQENEDLLISCISKDLGFSGCKPVVACLIYKCLLHWGSFEVERTSVFDRIIQRINLVVEGQINVATLSYWLSNSSILLLLLQRKMKASGTPQRLRSSASMGVRVPPQSTELPSRSGRLSNLHKFEAKYPAQVFKQQLTVLLEKIYGIIRDNLKKEISPLLISCVQAPRVSRVRSLRRSQSHASAFGQQTLTSNWQSIVRSLTNYLKILRANYVPPILVRKVFTQIFLFINVQLFNSLLLRRECCSFSNGEYVKAGLDELERWCYGATEEYAGSALDELNHIRQAVGFLASHQKPTKSLNEIISDLCPVLSVQQLYRICTMYWDDKYGTNTISSDVVSGMSAMMIDESNSEVNSSFMLDDDSSVPFSVDDLAKSVKDIEIADADLPSAIRENPGFAFLLKRNEY